MSIKVKKRADVSVVIPCFNCSDTIERALDSVLFQSAPPVEVIIVDDSSDEATIDKLRSVHARFEGAGVRIIYHERNMGPSCARNTGWNNAVANFVAFLDADDSWHVDKLLIQYGWMASNPNIYFSGHNTVVATQDSAVFENVNISKQNIGFKTVDFDLLLWRNQFMTPAVMVRRSIPNRFKAGKYYSEDFLLWLELTHKYGAAVKIAPALTALHKPPFSQGGLSGNLWAMQQGQVDTYKLIAKATDMPWFKLKIIVAWSYLRYLRRVIIRSINCIRRKDAS